MSLILVFYLYCYWTGTVAMAERFSITLRVAPTIPACDKYLYGLQQLQTVVTGLAVYVIIVIIVISLLQSTAGSRPRVVTRPDLPF